MEEAHRRSKQVRENYRTPEWSQIKLRENNNEVRVPAEQVTCWRCGESGHRKKECWKILFCTNCGKQGHNSNKCRQMAQKGYTYCEGLDNVGEYYLLG